MAYYSELIVSGIVLVLSIIGILGTMHFPIFEGSLPGVGLWPILMGILCATLAVVDLILSLGAKKSKNKTINKEEIKRVTLFYIFFVGMSVFGTFIMGMLPALMVFIIVSLTGWYQLSIRKSVIISAGLVGVIYGLFSVLLNVKFPMGLFQ